MVIWNDDERRPMQRKPLSDKAFMVVAALVWIGLPCAWVIWLVSVLAR